MTLVLSSQLESRLVSAARLHGLTPDAYAEFLLRRVLPDVSTPTEQQTPDPIGLASETIKPNDFDDEENRPRFGSAKGLITMSDDFDEPLEDFKEYMFITVTHSTGCSSHRVS